MAGLTARDLKVVRGAETYPYSGGTCIEALQSAGVPTDDAVAIVQEFEKGIRESRVRRIELTELLRLLADAAGERAGPGAAERLLRQTPPFVPLLVTTDGDEPMRFSRRTLMASLEKLGLPFKDAHAVTRQVEQGIRTEGIERLSRVDLARRVASTVEARHGRAARLRYEAQTHRPFEIRVKAKDGIQFPFSRGILARSLMGIGLGPDFSHNLAKRVEQELYARGHDVVGTAEVLEQVALLLRLEAGDEYARRYLIMRQMHERERPVMLLIGGAPGVGKSAIAAEVAYRLGIPRVVSTDIVRQALRSLIGPELSPTLHASSFTAWRAELLPEEQASAEPERNAVLRGFLAQVRQLDPAITAIVERSVAEDTSLVIEGVHLVPGTVAEKRVVGATILRAMLFVDDVDDHRKHFAVREVRTGSRLARPYLDHFDEIRVLHDYLLERSEAEGVLVVDATDFETAVERCVDHVLDALLELQRHELGAAEAVD
ncbi:MAG TPA: ATP cone domain-containing protein [Trueperaceae bacterium]|jgi:2-phosphoglycerate kinase